MKAANWGTYLLSASTKKSIVAKYVRVLRGTQIISFCTGPSRNLYDRPILKSGFAKCFLGLHLWNKFVLDMPSRMVLDVVVVEDVQSGGECILH